MTQLAYGLRHAIPATPTLVDMSTVHYDPDRQISMVTEGGTTLPVLRHTSGTTSTNTASQDNKGGSDSDQDYRED
ncbi:putative ATP-grasp-modified RiPP [Actinoplanes sp. NPDC049548]|uniref:putative ATP-grasp-modified RiPP n=1 Tax=Actinoplanes sp. NPDC049548 TaxID=3155152 RepID=UPI00341343FD